MGTWRRQHGLWEIKWLNSLDPLGCPRDFYLVPLEVFWMSLPVLGPLTASKHASSSHVLWQAGMELKPSFLPSPRASFPASRSSRWAKTSSHVQGAQEVGGVWSEPGKDTLVPMKI